MTFSSRFKWNFGKNRLSLLLEKKRSEGVDILDLTVSNPTLSGFAYDIETFADTVHQPDLQVYRPDPLGWAPARESVAAYYKDHGRRIDPQHVFLTASTSEAYSYVFKLLCDPDEEVLIPQPSYPLFEFLAGLEHIRIREYKLVYDRGDRWKIDLETLETAIGPKTRALVLVNPNNPTGSYVEPDELQRINQICRHCGLALIVDEVFLDYPAASEKKKSRKTVAGNSETLTFVLSGLSKMIAMPQLKLGWIAVSGPKKSLSAALARLELLADTYLSVSSFAMICAPELIRKRQGIQHQIMSRVEVNEKLLIDQARSVGAWEPMVRKGGWYSVVGSHTEDSDEDLSCDLIEFKNIYVHPGYFYGIEDQTCLVFSLITPEGTFRTGIERWAEFMKRNFRD